MFFLISNPRNPSNLLIFPENFVKVNEDSRRISCGFGYHVTILFFFVTILLIKSPHFVIFEQNYWHPKPGSTEEPQAYSL